MSQASPPAATADRPAPDTDTRVAHVAGSADLGHVAEAIAAGRDRILASWLDAASRQPFHSQRPGSAVADHIPPLFDAVVDLLRRGAGREREAQAPLDDAAVAREAQAHARVRFEQGLGPVAVITEFRLLRQEIARALAALLDDDARPADVVGGLAIVSDALDGAAAIGLTALSDRIEGLREAFLATTLHDIRQPVTLVEGSLHLADRWLGSETPDAARLREAVQDALFATAELVAMIDTLSDASRVAMGALEPDLEPASLGAIVRTCVEAFGADARARIMLDAPPGGDLIGLWDDRLIHRLVANLVGNALKYSPAGSAVRVSVTRGSPGQGRLMVADQGMGMSQEELAIAFERFARSERTRHQGIPGLGLGLFACRGIVEAHAGTIALSSDGPGLGTTVVVELPLLDVADLED